MTIPDVFDNMDHLQSKVYAVFGVLRTRFWYATDAVVTISQELYSKYIMFLKIVLISITVIMIIYL